MTEQEPDITETLRAQRDILALSGHEQLDAIEAAAAQGKNADVHKPVDALHTLIDMLAGIVVTPDFDEITARLDQHAIELAEHDDYEGAKLAIETAEAFARRHDRIRARAAFDNLSANTMFIPQDSDEAARDEAARLAQARARDPRQKW